MDRGSICGRTGVAWWGGWHGRCWPRLPKTPCGYVQNFVIFTTFLYSFCKPGCFCWGLHTFWSAKYSAILQILRDISMVSLNQWIGQWVGFGFQCFQVFLDHKMTWCMVGQSFLLIFVAENWTSGYFTTTTAVLLRVNGSWWRGCHGRWDIFVHSYISI